MKLNEVFDAAVDWESGRWTFNGKTHVLHDKNYKFPNPKLRDRDEQIKPGQSRWAVDTYNFKIGKHRFHVGFAPVHGEDPGFGPAPIKLPKHMDLVDFEDWKGRSDITGKGGKNAYKIFATVINIMQNHMKRTNIPLLIGAHADEPSRVKLYSRMLDKIAVAKWKTNRSEVHPGENFPEEVMWLIMP